MTRQDEPVVSPVMLEVLQRALWLERRGTQREPWVHHPHKRVVSALVKAGLAEPYHVTPESKPHHLITDAGRAVVARLGGRR